jgi:hypothetical protein
MPRYVIQRAFSVGEDGLPELSRKSKRIIRDTFPEVIWLHSHVTVDDDGNARTFCIYEAPNPAAIEEHAELLGFHILDGVYEIAGDVTPDDFPLEEDAAAEQHA